MLYLTKDLFPVFVPLGVVGFYRYLWFLIKLLAYFFYRPMMPKASPTYRSEYDVTIIVPTIDAGEEFKEAAHSWLINNPKEIIIITETKMKDALQELANSVDPTRIRVLTVPKANKRLQMVEASTHIDGGVCCLSGRTAAYRTCILQDPQFQYEFTHDFWLGKYPLNSGDDKFLTRWMVYHGWNTYVQICKEAELFSTFKNNWRFVKQVLRWTRNTWRSDFRSLFMERVIWKRHPYVAFTMVDKIFNPITLLSGPISVIVMAADGKFHLPLWDIVISYVVWLMMTRIIKLLPHLFKRPQDIIWVPAFLIFGYYFAIMKVYALFTLHEVGWGTRAGIDQSPAELRQEKEKAGPFQEMSRSAAEQAALSAAAAAAAATAYEEQQQQQLYTSSLSRQITREIPRPESRGSADLIRHFSQAQQRQAQQTTTRARAAGHPSSSRPDDDDPDVYEYNQDDELAQYFAQQDAALASTYAVDQTIDQYGRRGGVDTAAGGVERLGYL
ncbi:hypothetical protein BGZ65_006938 [Modicella reniformis]|uniref:Glycosyltransferase family 2 protein n=1 Tax=Modicella reniformis TaxID=1440133 RepID=A0A9P6MKD2_9FUNG|nr:hypothetical protein BGZ65_006938 [Modicella reniformis]